MIRRSIDEIGLDALRFNLNQRHGLTGGKGEVLGMVCMELTMLDVSEIPGVQVEDEVVLLGKQGP